MWEFILVQIKPDWQKWDICDHFQYYFHYDFACVWLIEPNSIENDIKNHWFVQFCANMVWFFGPVVFNVSTDNMLS